MLEVLKVHYTRTLTHNLLNLNVTLIVISTVRLVVGLMLLIKECIEKGSVTLSEDSKLHINSDEVEKVGQVLEVCAVLLNSARKDLKRNRQAASTLCSKIVPLIPRILQEFGSDSVCNEALSLIMSKYHVT